MSRCVRLSEARDAIQIGRNYRDYDEPLVVFIQQDTHEYACNLISAFIVIFAQQCEMLYRCDERHAHTHAFYRVRSQDRELAFQPRQQFFFCVNLKFKFL